MPGGLEDGVYDHLLDEALAALVGEAAREREVDVADLDPARTPSFAAAHLRPLVERVLAAVKGDPAEKQVRRIDVLNRLLATLAQAADEHCADSPLDGGEIRVPAPRHLRLVRARPALGAAPPMILPETPLAESALLVNASGEPSLGRELTRELASADRVDLLCAFVKWSGLRFVLEDLAALVARARARGEATPLRVLTTTYIGASDVRAIEELARLGAEVRISYDDRRTRLHAKAWLFHRESGSHTAYIGSSNLSHAALHEGLEWNVRLAWRDAGPLLDKFRAAFESYWDSDEFEAFDHAQPAHRERVVRALAAQRGGDGNGAPVMRFDLRPHPYQEPMLEALRVERERGHTRNLLVAPTGTGKTLVAAFDYAHICATDGRRPRLLFVAHRDRILSQSRAAFAAVLREPAFGELLIGARKPTAGDHVFATIQSLARLDLARDLPPERFEVVIVDEFHHAEAPTYDRLLSHVRPRVLLGLTATPERHDGGDVRRWFDGRTAYELRLWDALEQGLLAPFQYFGAKDAVDLDAVAWRRGWGYDREELSALYTGSDARARLVLRELHRRVRDPAQMRALGFCVSVEHARFMARRFEEAGLASVAVTGETPGTEREAAIQRLEAGKLQALFTVDLFNEGVDIPRVDTVLFLRPTESATVFLQQLGRGLRLHREKPCLTVLDFIGNARKEFRFDRRFRTLLGGTTRQVERQIEAGFPYLPPGCAMQLDAQAQAVVLANIRRNVGAGQRWLTEELSALGPDATLGEFLSEAGVAMTELYANRRSFSSLRQSAFGAPALDDDLRALHAQLRTILHVTDPERLAILRRLTVPPPPSTLPDQPTPASPPPGGGPPSPPRSGGEGRGEGDHPPSAETTRQHRLTTMLAAALLDVRRPADACAALESANQNPTFCAELSQLLDVIEDANRDAVFEWRHTRPSHSPVPVAGGPVSLSPAPVAGGPVSLSPAQRAGERVGVRGSPKQAPQIVPAPLWIHARYRQEEVLAALGVTGEKTGQIPRLQAGVFYVPEENVDLLFVTLKKTDAGFSPTTMYRDYAMSPSRFHWESQNTAHPGSPTGARYLARSSTVLLFVRETQEQPNGVAEPYWFLGPVTLESALGERPMQIVWRLEHPMPGQLYQRATVALG
jgi:superfamily II DNA or RNA helicase/HKD family nuclease